MPLGGESVVPLLQNGHLSWGFCYLQPKPPDWHRFYRLIAGLNESDLFKGRHDLIELRWGRQNVVPRNLEVPLLFVSFLPVANQSSGRLVFPSTVTGGCARAPRCLCWTGPEKLTHRCSPTILVRGGHKPGSEYSVLGQALSFRSHLSITHVGGNAYLQPEVSPDSTEFYHRFQSRRLCKCLPNSWSFMIKGTVAASPMFMPHYVGRRY